jgi:23S rRNA (cytosine1962-C5)-methyltransferase
MMVHQPKTLARPPLICFEDDHLLVINKPPGVNTHAPSPFAGEGVYEWLRHRDPRWARLAIIHRLDKETSGVMVFGKTAAANRSLTEQFSKHSVRKKYRLITDGNVSRKEFVIVSALVRVGDKYASRPLPSGGERVETRFRIIDSIGGQMVVEAEPITGRTHQIRVHAAAAGFPVLGDTLYGGTAAARVYLHSEELTLKHPVTDSRLTFQQPSDFTAEPGLALRAAVIETSDTNAFRLIHGGSDKWPGWYLDRLGDFLLSQSELPLTGGQEKHLNKLLRRKALAVPAQEDPGPSRTTHHAPRTTHHRSDVISAGCGGAYHKILGRHASQAGPAPRSPQYAMAGSAPERFQVRENGVQYELSFNEGYSVGLFLDQRDNRRRFLANHVAADFPLFDPGTGVSEVLNTFAYTCGFSVCAALSGAKTTNIDLSKKYLDWGKRNFALNQIEAANHDFICGDVFDWLRRFGKRGRLFEVIVLDPPTFSQAKGQGTFQAKKDYGKLVAASLSLLKPEGVLLACSNAAKIKPEQFLQTVTTAVGAAKRAIIQRHYVPQPPDFPITRGEPAYLKTVWLKIR